MRLRYHYRYLFIFQFSITWTFCPQFSVNRENWQQIQNIPLLRTLNTHFFSGPEQQSPESASKLGELDMACHHCLFQRYKSTKSIRNLCEILPSLKSIGDLITDFKKEWHNWTFAWETIKLFQNSALRYFLTNKSKWFCCEWGDGSKHCSCLKWSTPHTSFPTVERDKRWDMFTCQECKFHKLYKIRLQAQSLSDNLF